jgi:hypothetical protein
VSTRTGFHIMLGAGALLVVGALLPWATVIAPFVGTISAAGTDGDGVITLVLGLLVGACGIVGLRSQRGSTAKIAGAIGLVVAAVIGCYNVATISNAAGDVPELDLELHASVGMGLWLTVAAAMGGLGGLFLTRAR